MEILERLLVRLKIYINSLFSACVSLRDIPHAFKEIKLQHESHQPHVCFLHIQSFTALL